MKFKNIFSLMILLFIVIKSYSQITVTIENVLVNNQTNITNCETIDFGTISNNNLNFSFKLSKPLNQAVGDGQLKIMLKHSSSSNGVQKGSSVIVLSDSWIDNASTNQSTFQHSIQTNISASDIQISGSSIYLQFGSSNNLSCEHPLIKTPTPTFELDNDSYTISCGSTSLKTFTVNNVYNSPGTLSYSWNVGSGWKRNGSPVSGSFTTTTNSITLEPVSGTVLPSNVSVTTSLDGVSYGTETATVSRGNFNPAYTISGNSQLCTTASYIVNNLPTGTSVTSWSVSNTNIATISGIGNQANLNANGNGTVRVLAQLTNACGQTATIDKYVDVGAANVTNPGINGGNDNEPINSYSQLSVDWVTGNNIQYYWTLSLNSNNCNPSNSPGFLSSGTLSFTSSSPYATIAWGSCTGVFTVTAWAQNNCGNTYIGSKMITVFDSSSNPCARTSDYSSSRIFPNPVKKGGNINYREHPGDPCNNTRTSSKSETNVKIYDLQGQLVFEKSYKSKNFTIKNIKLDKGSYIMNILSSNGNLIKELIIVE